MVPSTFEKKLNGEGSGPVGGGGWGVIFEELLDFWTRTEKNSKCIYHTFLTVWLQMHLYIRQLTIKSYTFSINYMNLNVRNIFYRNRRLA